MENVNERPDLTPEELEAKRTEMLLFYENSMTYLKAQHDYEEMLLKIDEVRYKRASIQVQFAMMAQAQRESEEQDIEDSVEQETPQEKPARKLKKQ